MASNPTVDVKFSSDTSGLNAGLDEAANKTKATVEKMKTGFEGLNDSIKLVTKAFLAFEGIKILANVFENIIDNTVKATREVTHFADILGVTSTQASVLKQALQQIGSSLEAYQSTYFHFVRQLKANPDIFKALGVDTSGNAMQSFQSALNIIQQYKAGIDQTEVSMALFGRSVDEVTRLAKLNEEGMRAAGEQARDWGLIVTNEDKAAADEWIATQADLHDMLEAFEKVIASALLPVLTDLAHVVGEMMPGALEAMRVALAALVALLDAAIFTAKTFANTLAGAFATASYVNDTASRSLGAALHGNFSEALDTLKNGATGVKTIWSNVAADIGKDTDATTARISRLTDQIITMGKSGTPYVPKGGNKEAPNWGELQDKASGNINKFDDQLLTEKLNYARRLKEQGKFGEMSKAQEAAYWNNILKTADLSEKQKDAITKKAQEAELASLTKHGAAKNSLAKSQSQNAIKDAEHDLAMKKLALDHEVAMGRITKEQELVQLQKFEEEKYEIEKAALERELELASKDPNLDIGKRQQILDQMLELQRKHEEAMLKLKNQSVEEQNKYNVQAAKDIESSFTDMIQGLVSGQKSLKDSLMDFISSITQALAKVAAQNLATQLFGGGGSSGGGGLGSLIGNLFGGGGGGGGGFLGSLFSFDVGTNYVPDDMIAMVHKGEQIIPASQNKTSTTFGGNGGITVNMNVSTPDANSFRQSKGQIAASLHQTLATAARRNK